MQNVMNPQALIADLTARGICFQADGDRLLYRPISAVTDAEVGLLRQHKSAIMAMIASKSTQQPNDPPERSAGNGAGVHAAATDELIDYSDWCWGQISEKDLKHLTGPRDYPSPCTWCSGRLVHNSFCNDLRRSWEPVLPCGRYGGRRISDVPRNYLSWFAENASIDAELRKAIERYLESAD